MAFLDPAGPRLAFGRMIELAAEALEKLGAPAVGTLADIMEVDAAARTFVRERLDAPRSAVVTVTAPVAGHTTN